MKLTAGLTTFIYGEWCDVFGDDIDRIGEAFDLMAQHKKSAWKTRFDQTGINTRRERSRKYIVNEPLITRKFAANYCGTTITYLMTQAKSGNVTYVLPSKGKIMFRKSASIPGWPHGVSSHRNRPRRSQRDATVSREISSNPG